ncbi:unnamed protein product [Pieris brassicae]|uniref:Uncharacterized protein n=1 Tax=Pieris brassicae TaxID=7116 RepID=A0A9P0X908_PIEBR|nr:unnamed protein product [Pieris brassicae]
MRLIIVSVLVAAVSGAAITPVEERLENNSTSGFLDSEVDIEFCKDLYDKQNNNRNKEQTANTNEGNEEQTTAVTESDSWVTETDVNLTTFDINDETTTQDMTELFAIERMCVLAILCFAAIATALPLDNTALNNNVLSTEKLPIESTNFPPSHDNLNQGNASSIEKSGETENNSKDYHEGRGDTPLLELGSYEEQNNKEKEITLNTNGEPTLENEKIENNITSEFAEHKSADKVPVTETNTLLVESTTLPVSTEKKEETTLVSTSNSLQEIQGLENQKTISAPSHLFDIQRKQLKENITSPAPNPGPQNEQVSEQEIISLPVPKSDSEQKEQEFKNEARKVSESTNMPSSTPVSVSQPKEQFQKKQDITLKSFPKPQTKLKKEISVSEPKTTSNLAGTETKQSGQSLKKQILPSSNLLAFGNSKRQKGEPKVHSLLPVIKSQPKGQVLKKKDKTSPLLSAFNIHKELVIPSSDSRVLQKEREPNAEKSNPAVKLKGLKMKQKPQAVAPVHILESQQKQKVPEREEITSFPSDIEKENELGVVYNCDEERLNPWLNVGFPTLLYGNGIQAPIPMKYVVIFWLVATVAAIPSTEKDVFLQLGDDRDGADVAAGPAINPTTIGSFNQQSNIHNLENQEKDTENLHEKGNEEERFEELVQPNLLNGENLYGNAIGIEPEPIVAIPGPAYEDAYVPVPLRRPSIFSGLFSFLPSWITSFSSKWPFKKPIFHRASILYPDYYYPEDEIEQIIY